MKIDPDTIDHAFNAFHDRYVAKVRRAWDLDYHVKLWGVARRALVAQDVQGFVEVYDELRSHWQLTRGKGALLAAPAEIFTWLCNLPSELRDARLSQQTESTAPALLDAVKALTGVKQTGSGSPSIMAISKILHFFNPRLFVIVDRGMVWNWALNHMWLWHPIETMRSTLCTKLQRDWKPSSDGACDDVSYVAILLWAGQVLRDNPTIPGRFADYLRTKCSDTTLPADLEDYEAVAMEWLLLGLVDLPPKGVILGSS